MKPMYVPSLIVSLPDLWTFRPSSTWEFGTIISFVDRKPLLPNRFLYTDQTANNSAHVKDDPKPRNKSAFESLRRIRHHNRALRRPENTRATSEHEPGKDDVTEIPRVIVAQIRADIDAVSQTAEREGDSDAESVGDGAGEETDDGKGGVES